MADAKYLANRLKYHTASRIATQTGEALAQALNVDGHIITTNKVWASPQTAFINNVNKANTDSVNATNDLVRAFKYGLVKTQEYNSLKGDAEKQNFNWGTPEAVSASFWNGGTVWTNEKYPAVKLYEKVPMTVVTGSDGGGKFQAFEIMDRDFILTSDKTFDADKKYYTYNSESEQYVLAEVTSGTQVTPDTYYEAKYTRAVDWIAPTAVADQETGSPVAGYSGIPMYNGTALKLADTSKWAEAGGHYEFAYLAGMLTFEPGYTPQDKAAGAVNTETGKTYITLTAFKYKGTYLSDTISNLATSETIETINNDIDTISGDINTISGDITTINNDIDTISGDINTINGDIDTITGNIGTISGDINTINGDIDVLQAEVDTITLVTEPIKTVSAGKTVTYNGGKTIVGTAVEAAVDGAATGDVTVTLEGKDFELLSFYQKYANGQMEIIYPEIAKTAGTDGNSIYTLTADYGEAVSGITSSLVWEINCKVK